MVQCFHGHFCFYLDLQGWANLGKHIHNLICMYMNTESQTGVFLDWVTKVITDLTFWLAWAA